MAYIGEIVSASGPWVGVHFDEATGKNDGSVEGKRYFSCPALHGRFVKPSHFRVAVVASSVDLSRWSSHIGEQKADGAFEECATDSRSVETSTRCSSC